ncbi:MAG TPA: prepilin-type N-terminal cleavage/methylation domain-containing protein [bacterium]|nr:prepilin-type N-terminal cleavage/methylation domain-containing protein [bacterium]HOL93771.1 prepilin-type N-terminal cleavage/methylation domain-containing protein [bacterium]HPP01822.1 prepilin-type N-terminal cleavage/methylation domain-containing protein [bacterium]HXK94332.1 prepilin-type N-terminal cleavage/methylation domain-containing protein [bacterium]
MNRSFTLIELLIVVAIIGILAAIAVPNFLNAQVRAKVSRAKADIRTMENAVMMYMIDNNGRPIDCDDPGSGAYLGGLGCGTPQNGAPEDVKGVPEFSFAPIFMSFSQLRIFTTPIAYLSGTSLMDAFCSKCAITYNTRYSGSAKQPESFTFSSLGPDHLTGDWGFFFRPGGNPDGVQYDPSNGLTARGDIFVSNVFSDIDSNRSKTGRLSY